MKTPEINDLWKCYDFYDLFSVSTPENEYGQLPDGCNGEAWMAATDEDLKLIYDREFKASGLKNRTEFRMNHKRAVNKILTNIQPYAEKEDLNLVNRYLKFVDQQRDEGWTLEEIALICIFTGEPVNPQTAGEILEFFNPALTSGRKLREVYNRLIHSGERTRLTENKSGDLKRARNITRVIQYLGQNNHKTDQARQELGTLQNNINRHYS